MPAAADTAQPSDTTPPSPAAAGKAAKGGGTSKAPEATATDQAAVAPPEAATEPTEPAPAEPELEPGWFRNTSVTDLVVMPDRYPSATLAPGEAAWLPDDPHHPDLDRFDAPTPDATAADTAGSEK